MAFHAADAWVVAEAVQQFEEEGCQPAWFHPVFRQTHHDGDSGLYWRKRIVCDGTGGTRGGNGENVMGIVSAVPA